MMGLTGVYGAVDTRARSGVSAVGAASAGGEMLPDLACDSARLVIPLPFAYPTRMRYRQYTVRGVRRRE